MSALHDRIIPVHSREIPVVLSIAGSDCSAGAGIQADLKTCMSAGVYGATVITAVTAQNPYELKKIGYVGDEMLRSQLECVFNSIMPDAIKIGMIPCPEAVEIISGYLKDMAIPVVIDPVLGATAGGSLHNNNSLTSELICNLLFPKAELVTPNLPELRKLTSGYEDMPTERRAEMIIGKYGAKHVLVKGGHAAGAEAVDILFSTEGEKQVYRTRRINSPHTHGTGCTLSSAIACGLAKGLNICDAIGQAKQLVTQSIERAARHPLYADNGPLIHFKPESD